MPGVINEASLSALQKSAAWTVSTAGHWDWRFVSFVIYNTEGNGQQDNMERRRSEGMWEEGDGSRCTSKWLCLPECAAQSLVTRLSEPEGSLSLREAQAKASFCPSSSST